jgi:hypothetical protein
MGLVAIAWDSTILGSFLIIFIISAYLQVETKKEVPKAEGKGQDGLK